MTDRRHNAAPGSAVRAPKIDSLQGGVKLRTALSAPAIGALAVSLGTACTSPKRPAPIDVAAFWPTFMGSHTRAPFIREHVQEDPPNVVWSASAGSGLRGMPVVTDEVIIASSADRYVNVLSRLDGSTLWRKRLDGPPVPPLVRADIIYTATERDGKLRVLNLEEGDNVWKWDLPSVAQPISLAGDTVYVASEGRMLHALDTADRFEVWRARFSGRPVSGPLVMDGWVAYVTSDSLHLLDRHNGNRQSASPTLERVVGEAASEGGRVFAATEMGSLLAWRLPDLELLWQASGFEAFESGPVIADSVGYAVSRTGQLVRFDLEDGSARVIARPGGTVLAPPTVVENGILVGNLQGVLFFFTRNGEPVWQVELAGSVEGPVFVHEGRLVVPMLGPVGGALGTAPIRGKLMELR